MSGVQGPLETRTKTTVETQFALQGLDATPFDSGELAYVRATGATYELVREDTTVGPSTFDSVSVGPPGAVGRWRRLCFQCTGTGSSGGGGSLDIVAFAELLSDASAPGVFPVDLLTVSITTTTPGSSLLIEADLSALISAGGVTIAGISVDGVVHGPSNMTLQNQGSASAVESSSLTLKIPVSVGPHTVAIEWLAPAGTGVITLPGGGHATLAVEEVL